MAGAVEAHEMVVPIECGPCLTPARQQVREDLLGHQDRVRLETGRALPTRRADGMGMATNRAGADMLQGEPTGSARNGGCEPHRRPQCMVQGRAGRFEVFHVKRWVHG
jgi:hypothetical protein